MNLKTIAQISCLLAGMVGVAYLQHKRPQRPVIEGVTFAFNEGKPAITAEVARAISFGYDRALAATLWLRFLQYTPPEKVPKGQSSWVFFDLDTISAIDPQFTPVFTQGALFLSVITEDRAGAERILKRGAELFPDNWRILGNLAYHYHFEEKRFDKAGPYYLAASRLPGAPQLLGLLAATYLKEAESPEASLAFLRNMEGSVKNETIQRKLKEKIQELEGKGGSR